MGGKDSVSAVKVLFRLTDVVLESEVSSFYPQQDIMYILCGMHVNPPLNAKLGGLNEKDEVWA